MSTTAVPSAAAQKQLKQGKVKKGIFSVIRHLVLALLAFIWLVPIACLTAAAARRNQCWCCGTITGLTAVRTQFGPRMTCARCAARLDEE